MPPRVHVHLTTLKTLGSMVGEIPSLRAGLLA